MFISIPKDFFVPVLFTDNFTLNLDNNNMEYDVVKENIKEENYRGDMKAIPIKVTNKQVNKPKSEDITEESEEKAKVEEEIKLDNASDGQILEEADEEFIHSETVGE